MDEQIRTTIDVVRTGRADELTDAWYRLFASDPLLATATAFDLLAGAPRIKPSRALLVDPGDSVWRQWERRVAAAAALLAAPSVDRVFAELRDELAEDPDLATDVLAVAAPHPTLDPQQRAALEALRGRPTTVSPT